MLNKSEVVKVGIATVITIGVEVILAIVRNQRSHQGRALDPAVYSLGSLAVIGLGTFAVIAMLGPKSWKTWLVAIVFVIVTMFGSFFASEVALSYYTYQRDFTHDLTELEGFSS